VFLKLLPIPVAERSRSKREVSALLTEGLWVSKEEFEQKQND